MRSVFRIRRRVYASMQVTQFNYMCLLQATFYWKSIFFIVLLFVVGNENIEDFLLH